MNSNDAIPKPVVAALVERLEPAPGTLQVDEVTSSFPWASRHRLWAGYDARGLAACVAFDGARARVLTGDDLGPLARVLVDERGSLLAYTADELATAVRRLTRPDPIGYLGDESVLLMPVMRRRPPGDPTSAVLEQTRRDAAVPPRLVDVASGARAVAFSYWRKDGGVDAWSVELGPRGFGEVVSRELAPAGSYLYAYC
jgi:hypothetical protein